jgi:hypothetical protein
MILDRVISPGHEAVDFRSGRPASSLSASTKSNPNAKPQWWWAFAGHFFPCDIGLMWR